MGWWCVYKWHSRGTVQRRFIGMSSTVRLCSVVGYWWHSVREEDAPERICDHAGSFSGHSCYAFDALQSHKT
ncbi:unnamed protein product [Anisakis simplex]|uniref:Uncharacterized protein n=1 Tax=Anisakis simplex TaxID=6269 RepID=A0A0M3JNJ7_ANISI|nr:unnamed protein product [Anisakis simplex]